jgi:hypothetical protein
MVPEQRSSAVMLAQVVPELIEPAAGKQDLTQASTAIGTVTPTQIVGAVSAPAAVN